MHSTTFLWEAWPTPPVALPTHDPIPCHVVVKIKSSVRTRAVDRAGNAWPTKLLVLNCVPTKSDGTTALFHGEVTGQRSLTDDLTVWGTTTRVVTYLQVTGARTHVYTTAITPFTRHVFTLKPNTHHQRRRDSTVAESRRRCERTRRQS